MKTITWLTESYAVLNINGREEKIYKAVRSCFWISTFNGKEAKFKTQQEALNYADGKSL